MFTKTNICAVPSEAKHLLRLFCLLWNMIGWSGQWKYHVTSTINKVTCLD